MPESKRLFFVYFPLEKTVIAETDIHHSIAVSSTSPPKFLRMEHPRDMGCWTQTRGHFRDGWPQRSPTRSMPSGNMGIHPQDHKWVRFQFLGKPQAHDSNLWEPQTWLYPQQSCKSEEPPQCVLKGRSPPQCVWKVGSLPWCAQKTGLPPPQWVLMFCTCFGRGISIFGLHHYCRSTWHVWFHRFTARVLPCQI